MNSLFIQLGVLIIGAATLAGIARAFRQPIVLAYLLTGVLLGAGGLHVIPNSQVTHDIAEVGILFLLFLVGLELDSGKLRRLGGVVIITGLAQMAITGAVAVAFTLALGYSLPVAGFLGLAASFSSTAVVLKYLSDRQETTSLAGRVTIGILLLQDIVAIIALIIISAAGHGHLGWLTAVWFVVKAAGMLGGTWLVSRFVLGPLFFRIAKSPELLFLASIGWAFLFSLISEGLGFSREIGAFLAGLSLATLPYSLEIIGRVRPLKDFFLVIFFVVLGLEVSWSVVGANWLLILGLAAIVILLKSISAAAVMVRLGYPKRPSYRTGAVLGQTSEFSLLIILVAAANGAVPADTVGIVAALLILTITLNSYWNSLSSSLFRVFGPPLSLFTPRRVRNELHFRPSRLSGHAVLFGANRFGAQMLGTLGKLKRDVLVVDHDPEVIRRLSRRRITSVYGDLDDSELLGELGLAEADLVVSTVSNVPATVYLVERTRRLNKRAMIIATGEDAEDALALYAAGADYVVVPRLLSGEEATRIVRDAQDATQPADLKARRRAHIALLKRHARDLARG